MEKYLASYDQCVALKELGFRKRVNYYFEDGVLKIHPTVTGWDFNVSFTTCVSRPTKAQVFVWFREKYNLYVHVDDFTMSGKVTYDYTTRTLGSQEDNPRGQYTEYHEAESASIDELIKIIKNK